MNFKQFLLLEQDPMGGGAPMGDMMGGGAPPMDPGMGGGMGMGGPPMGMDPMGGMGGPPMGGGAEQPPAIPKEADVWDVLDAILNKKPLEAEQEPKQPAPQADPMAGGMPPAPPMGGAPPMGAPPPPMGGMDQMGGGMVQPPAPHLMQ